MSILVQFHGEYPSLERALDSWVAGGLLELRDETLFFINGIPSTEIFSHRLPTAFGPRVLPGRVRVVAQAEDLPNGAAITRMVQLATHDTVRLVEKYWALVEPRGVVASRLLHVRALLASGAASIVRLRHRDNPGVPLHALIMNDGREVCMMRKQPNLLCYVHHWQQDPTVVYPAAGGSKMWRCGGEGRGLSEEDIYCAPSRLCQWTNNPSLFSRRRLLAEWPWKLRWRTQQSWRSMAPGATFWTL